MKDPPKKFFRLSPGNEVRLRYGHILKCERVITDSAGVPVELKCTIDTESLNGSTAARGEGHDSLGVGRARRRRRGAALRASVQVGGPRRRRPRPVWPISIPSHYGPHGLQSGFDARKRRRRLEVPVRAAGLLLRGPRFALERTSVQSNGYASKTRWAKISCKAGSNFSARAARTTSAVVHLRLRPQLQSRADRPATAGATSSYGRR